MCRQSPHRARVRFPFSAHRLFVVLAVAGSVAAAVPNLLPPIAPAATPVEPGWSFAAPRPDLAPRHAIRAGTGGATLELAADRFENFGIWSALAREIVPGKFYRFEVSHQARRIKAEAMSVAARLAWFATDDGSGRHLQVDYADAPEAGSAWPRRRRVVQAPPGARSVRAELILRWTGGGSVAWREPVLAEDAPPAPRRVRIATTRIRPGAHYPDATVAKNMRLMLEMFDCVGPERPDVVLFSETLADRNVPLPRAQTAQTIPGPLTESLGEKARRYSTHVITSLHEREGDLLYNTAVLIDRQGRVAGKYRKVHLTIGESGADGLTPGSDYPVFDTDFGRVGLMICWDNWYPEPARVLRLKGAELLFLPLAGDTPAHWETISRARAIDNGVYLVSSLTGGKIPSSIINPMGETIAEVGDDPGFIVREIDLNQEWRVHALSVTGGRGEPRSLYLNDRRPDTYRPIFSRDPPARQAAETTPFTK